MLEKWLLSGCPLSTDLPENTGLVTDSSVELIISVVGPTGEVFSVFDGVIVGTGSRAVELDDDV